ncbi:MULTISPECIES: hypothetical protein [Brevibacillus]|jgi:hypothetical protein|uniref:DUF3139 domain-containing protein n=1 Tax=Brevibacillus aydinogluensis TaxID=927786 RepID=A0AA48MEI5_9BACL|nr:MULTISPECIES: hypothetical protein [Bacillales]UFJ62804.1 hypothetical protein IRT44_08700 [Anoxybacillus sediminis]CAJ1004066.1 DUF3139 domain-containing protein [Brevibacillus aydinogluensis]
MKSNWFQIWVGILLSILTVAVVYGIVSIAETAKETSREIIYHLQTKPQLSEPLFAQDGALSSGDAVILHSTLEDGSRFLWIYDTKSKKMVLYRFTLDGSVYKKGEKILEQMLE